MKRLRLTMSEKRLLAAFQNADAQRADVVLAQFRAGEISREDFRWLIGDEAEDVANVTPRKSRGTYGYAAKYNHGFSNRSKATKRSNHNAYSNASGKNAARQDNELGKRVNDCKTHSAASAAITSFPRVSSAREGRHFVGVSSL